MTTHVHVMYMFDHHVHALNLLIINTFGVILPYHVHVCAKFEVIGRSARNSWRFLYCLIKPQIRLSFASPPLQIRFLG